MAAAQSNGALIDPDEHSTAETLASRHNVWRLSGLHAWEAKPSRRSSANHLTATVFKGVAITVTVLPAHHSASLCRSFGLWLMSGLNWARPPPSLPALERAALWSSPSRCAGLRRPVGRHARWLYDQSVSRDEDSYLLPAIAAVVVGGTNILGGRGRYLGTLFGVISIVLLNSVPSNMQVSEASQQSICGTVIIATLFVYGRADKITS
jgi:hypothetical protein